MELTELKSTHEMALRDFLADFAEAGESTIPAYFADPAWSHAEIVANFAAQARGEGLPDGWVPATTLFLVDNGRILGVANIRHRLTEPLRRFGGHVGYSVRPSERRKGFGTELLERVKDYVRTNLEIDRILVTCTADNVVSARIIESCGGILEEASFYEPAQKVVRRYWIAL